MIYVDGVRKRSVDGKRKEWLAMATADEPKEIQHLAEVMKIGPRYKLGGAGMPCYYLTPTQRLEAIEMGAKEVSTLELVKIRFTRKVSK